MGEGEVNSREAIERAFGGWPENRLEFTRALAIVSKKDSRDNLQIALEIIFSESNLEPAAERQRLQVKEIAAKAANDRRFLLAIDGLHEYYSNGENAASSDQYKTLEIQRKELQLHKIEADPYFRSLKLLLETSSLYSREHQNIATDDIILGTLQFVSDIRDDIPAMDSYLKTEYQQLSDQAENFAVALIDEVRDEEELSTVIKMEDKFSEGVDDVFEDRLTWMREGIEKVSLIQHAINLRCKTFVVSKNCQHLLKEVIFGRTFYRFWDDPRVKTGTGMPTLLILLMKVILSFLCGVVMTLLVPAYILISLVNWCLKNKHCSGFCEFYLKCCCCQKNCCGFCELYERPCQKYLLELWWFIAFLSLVFITSDDNDFSQKDLSSRSGLTYPYIFVFAFVVAFWLRFLTRIPEIPCCRLPDILTVVEFASLLCFTISIIWWIIRWEQLDGWRPSDSGFQDSNISYSVASLLCFFKLAHYLKAQYTLGTLNLSLYMMITYDVIYFAIIFVSLLFVPFGNALKKMYSYYEVDNMNNATHALARRERTYGDLFWRMLGSDMRKDIEISDPNYAYMKVIGEVFIAMFAVAAVVVALNMLIATMDYTCKNIMENVDKEYVFSRTKMWIEYIAEDHSVLPPPLNLADIIKLGYKCSKCFQCKRSNETSQEDIEEKRKKRISIIKRLVLRYLRRSLIPDSTEYFQVVLTQSSASLEQVLDPNHPPQV